MAPHLDRYTRFGLSPRKPPHGSPAGAGGLDVTGVITMESLGASRTRYVARAAHQS
ncbi:MAG: hypothetical protein IT359_04155 [Gemmatimonadaceae bacterium]|nr:hypothetical protein [Gemmatimonadaceae bacterium]